MCDIRPMRADDKPEILRLWHEGWHDSHADLVPQGILAFRTPEHFSLWLEEALDSFYVAVDIAPIGFVSLKGAEVVKLYVSRSARDAGTARTLLSFAENLLLKNGEQKAELFCTAGNSRAERFYQRAGWHLASSFEDTLWVPGGVEHRFSVRTHHFEKTLRPSA
ncbi:GNAT family N-acetyltransferase [Ensifer adhaerens]|uniref:GNAT family N-acetyltransferase n=1 Tax=Ensifer adhaerens TaxID=106592 RepID=UPI00098F83F5|nr:GNAT family N-acetyltransferase [Ensifer adhaerens]